MKNKFIMFWFIAIIFIISIFIIIFKPTKLGLDLVGGSRLVLEAQKTDTIPVITKDMMNALHYAIEHRVNALGVSETVVQQSGDNRLIVEIPNVSDPKKAKEFLGETAQLEFKKMKTNPDSSVSWIPTGLSGKDVKKSLLATNPTNGQWVVSLEFNDKGTKKFAKLTQELVGQPMAIFFNGELMSAPVIQEPIIGGNAQITGGDGGFKHDDAKNMVDLLNAGALPVPAKIIQENSVGPTLGADSIKKSQVAAFIGISLVMLFMLIYYRIPGLVANIALIVYAAIVFAIFKLIPVTLTLAGIAGFILSVGMAVDANILIFERTKEELKSGKNLFSAINAGFDRAFTSIFDSNISTIITCIILYILGTSIVKGFALTLAIGVAVSMFTAITVTKNFMHLLLGSGKLTHPEFFGIKASEISVSASSGSSDPIKQSKYGLLD